MKKGRFIYSKNPTIRAIQGKLVRIEQYFYRKHSKIYKTMVKPMDDAWKEASNYLEKWYQEMGVVNDKD